MSTNKDYRFLKSMLGRVAGAGLVQDDDTPLEKGVKYSFITGIVNDVISNPYEYLRKKVDADQTVTVGDLLSGRKTVQNINVGLQNKDLIETAPINSIIAQLIDPGVSSSDGVLPVLCYPFFPPHLSLPLNPGEYVWIIEVDVKGSKLYYWMCRQVGPIHVDDLNYTNMERSIATSLGFDQYLASSKTTPPSSESLEKMTTLDSREDSTNSSMNFSKLFANSNAYRKEFTGEPVPRLSKNCGDLLLQGSNNTGIHLTTEKFTDPDDAKIENKKYSGKSAESESLPTRKPDSAAIDIFIKRKKRDLDDIGDNLLSKDAQDAEKINAIANNSLNDFYTYIENDKVADLRYQDDSVFDKELVDDITDAIDVGARVYLSHKCDVDNTFLISFDDLGKNAKSGPSILTYAKHNRIVGEDDVRLVSRIGESYVDLDEKGNIVLKAAKGGAYISLRTDGSIAIVPGKNGLLYLGGEPGQAINTPLGNVGAPTGGSVKGVPITTTMGGVAGQEGPTGTFSTKVMFK